MLACGRENSIDALRIPGMCSVFEWQERQYISPFYTAERPTEPLRKMLQVSSTL